jgi:hypothetical protein
MELRIQSDNSVAVIDGFTFISLMAFCFVTVSLDVNLCHQNWYSVRKITASFVDRCTIRCETVRFRLQKYRNGGQLSVVNVFSYSIHAQTDC